MLYCRVVQANHIHGAHKAIALVMTCGLFELSKRPKWQDRLRAEAEVVLAAPGRTHTRAHLVREDITEGRLPDTLRFMREVVRRYPVSLGVLRSLGQDVTIGDNTYKKGMEILIPLYALHHSEKLWHRPMEFDPDRFGAANSVSVGALPVKGYPQPYFPFLDGQRYVRHHNTWHGCTHTARRLPGSRWLKESART